MKKSKIVDSINILAKYLAERDVKALTPEECNAATGRIAYDLIILLGNALPCVSLAAGEAYKAHLADNLLIAGGIGHSTKLLYHEIKNRYQQNVQTEGRSEAEVIADMLNIEFGIEKESMIIESKSTNCGDNAAKALEVIRQSRVIPRDVLLIQDPLMQRRTKASFIKEWEGTETQFYSYASFIPKVKCKHNALVFDECPDGIWSQGRFMSLLLGEIPRLRDDENGYGPTGKGYIAHVDMPDEVNIAYESLLEITAVTDRKI